MKAEKKVECEDIFENSDKEKSTENEENDTKINTMNRRKLNMKTYLRIVTKIMKTMKRISKRIQWMEIYNESQEGC